MAEKKRRGRPPKDRAVGTATLAVTNEAILKILMDIKLQVKKSEARLGTLMSGRHATSWEHAHENWKQTREAIDAAIEFEGFDPAVLGGE